MARIAAQRPYFRVVKIMIIHSDESEPWQKSCGFPFGLRFLGHDKGEAEIDQGVATNIITHVCCWAELGRFQPLVDFDRGVSPFGGDSDQFWREHPFNSGTGLFILGQH